MVDKWQTSLGCINPIVWDVNKLYHRALALWPNGEGNMIFQCYTSLCWNYSHRSAVSIYNVLILEVCDLQALTQTQGEGKASE